VKTDNWPPAEPGESLYEFVVANTGSDGVFNGSPGDLTDESRSGPQEILYVAGAKDGLFATENPYPAIMARASRIATLMATASRRPSKGVLRDVHRALAEDDSLDLADPLLKELRQMNVDMKTLHKIGRWLATTGANRSAVKIGITTLGFTGVGDDLDVVQALGRHEEFTLYSAIALRSGVPDCELLLLEAAQSVHGWGRIQTVRMLSGAKLPIVREWILREGFRNSIKNEYLAFYAATVGGLNEALRRDEVYRDLLTAAGQIFIALTVGKPFKGLSDYEDGDEAVEAYLSQLNAKAETATDVLAVRALQSYLQDENNWDTLRKSGWTAIRRETFERECTSILGLAKWETTARSDL
jgi:hypothetical protein